MLTHTLTLTHTHTHTHTHMHTHTHTHTQGMQQEFQALLDANLQPNQYTFAKMMDGYAYHGDYETIRQLMTEMTRYQVDVHRSMTSSLVTAYLSK